MSAHFRAFSFVDRILDVEPGKSIRGQYLIPPALEDFPSSLVPEAVGQCAAWSAMAAIDFSHRPVAGIAGRVELLAPVRPGQVLELSAEIESADTESVAYGGAAHVEGVLVARLQDCVGPMVPMEEFDDPAAMRERFRLLKSTGATPGAFGGVPSLELEPIPGDPGQVARSVLKVPADAPFFGDHFPRRPVFPGTLLMHANLQTAALLVAELGAPTGAIWLPKVVSEVKIRTFIAPGSTLALEAKLTERSASALTVEVESRINNRLIGSAEVLFMPGAPT
jgi:3-hydroxymyristoyl/3-hydroxydecanoyl-(acyl carrier protein) dehydratase